MELMNELDKRKAELERKAVSSKIELDCIGLNAGGVIYVEVKDIETYNMLRMRLYRLKRNYGKEYTLSVKGNEVTIKRIS
jgi:hypothetical protein